MAEPSKDDAAKALERLTSPNAPTPQPKPRVAPITKPQPIPKPVRPGAPGASRPPAPAVKATSAKAPAVRKTPAPPPVDLQQALAGSHTAAPGLRSTRRPKSDPGALQLTLKRTAIPVLLTLGFILVSLAVVHYAWRSDDNPVLELPTGIVIGLMAGGVVLWGLAGLNMVSVRRGLAARPQPR
jgi:hypothetical protein